MSSTATLSKNHASASSPSVSHAANWIVVGSETQYDAASYRWHGLKRGADPAHPFVLFQYTISGCGEYRSGGVVTEVPVGAAMVAVMPSDHLYTLPKNAREWIFHWMFITHPYAASRLISAQAKTGAVIPVSLTDPLLVRASSLHESARTGSYRDIWALEQSIIDFAIEYDRFADRLLYPSGEREAVLETARRIILERIRGSVDVASLAATEGYTRSHYTHRFKAATGISPGDWIDQVRMEEALRLLLDSDVKLESLAVATGYANANHFCKVFRKRFHISPGEYRRQMR